MFLIRESAEGLQTLHRQGGLIAELRKAESLRNRKPATAGEEGAWALSLPALARDLVDAGLGAVEMLIEYELPDVQGPADVVLAGAHPHTREPAYVVAELKQWRRVTSSPDKVGRFCVANLSGKPKKHPSEQVAVLCRELLRTHEVVAGHHERLTGLTYLHNAADHDVADLLAYRPTRLSHLFTRDSRGALMNLLRARLGGGSGREAAEQFVDARPPVERDQAGAEGIARWHTGFRIMSDLAAAERCLVDATRAAHAADRRRILLVTGATRAQGDSLVAGAADRLSGAGYSVRGAAGTTPVEQTASDMLFCTESWLRHPPGARLAPQDPDTAGSTMAEMIRTSRVPVFLSADDTASGPDAGWSLDSLVERAARDLRMRVQRVGLAEDFD
ncbi:hypothetical protein [Streptomyces kronopolitis]|uniref:hypothetical protein n=1 Tax=Streptomyces kronopolitis TaxID=1612435 RepID=UPI0020BDB624|nr:hypothetical protein [Streptomyces kronopolitis]MCL6300229.1 hypothetical protein [Streptomyces kronopolitis]